MAAVTKKIDPPVAKVIDYLLAQQLGTWAENDFIVTQMNEGQGKQVVTKGGSFRKFLMQRTGYHYNEPGTRGYDPNIRKWQVVANDRDKDDDYYDNRPWLLKRFGLHFVSWPGMDRIKRYRQSWWVSDPNAPNGIRERPDEDTNLFILTDYPYMIIDEEGLTADGVKVKTIFMVVIRITNPFVAFCQNNAWLKQATEHISAVARDYVGSFTYEQLRSQIDEKDAKKRKLENFTLPIINLNIELMTLKEPTGDRVVGMEEMLGIWISTVSLRDILPTGDFAIQNEKDALEAFGAAERAKARLIENETEAAAKERMAEAESKVTTLNGKAVATAIEDKLKAYATEPVLAGQMMETEAITNAKGTVIVIPGATAAKAKELLDSVLPR